MAEPLTLAQAKAQLRIHASDTTDDTEINEAIVEARGWIENYTGLILTRRTVVEPHGHFGCALHAWPVVSIDTVSYLDADGAGQALDADAYSAQVTMRPASLLRSPSARWPTVLPGSGINVTMTAGFADAAAVLAYSPNLIRAMKLLVVGFYDRREDGGLDAATERAAKALCRNHKDWRVPCV